MKIGITGSKGFIGKHLVGAFKNKKRVKLYGCDLPECNLLRKDSCKNFVDGKDVIIHTAAVNRGTDEEIIAGSVVATYNLISAMKERRQKARLIFLSSTQAETETIYGLSKKLTEIMLEGFAREHKIPVTILRVTNVFGEGCRPFYNSVVATFCYQAANDRRLTLRGGDKKMNFIYVKDLAKIILGEVFAARKKPFYFKRITTNNIVTVKKLVQLINSFGTSEPSKRLKTKFEKDLYNTYLFYKRQ